MIFSDRFYDKNILNFGSDGNKSAVVPPVAWAFLVWAFDPFLAFLPPPDGYVIIISITFSE